MKPALTIEPKPWMKDTALNAVMAALEPKFAMMVGGAVRAALLDEKVTDVDIATTHTPDEVIRRMTEAGIKTIPTGIEHGTVTAILDKKTFEITTLRQDVHTDGRHAEVVFSKDWIQDAKRRDFTINTLLMDPEGHIYDPTHQGLGDLKNGLIRFVGNPGRRINEDFLRILRFFRFHARYGKGRPDLEGVRACIRASENILKLSRERIFQEYEKILYARGAGEVLEQLRDYDILPGVVTEIFDQHHYKTLQKLLIARPNVDKKLLFAYSVWRSKDEPMLDALEKVFALSNAFKSFLKSNTDFVAAQPMTLNAALYHHGKDVTLTGSILYNLLNEKHASLKKLESLVDIITATPIPVLPLNGNDIGQLMNIAPGREVGEMLKAVEDWWLGEDAKPSRERTLEYVRSLKN